MSDHRMATWTETAGTDRSWQVAPASTTDAAGMSWRRMEVCRHGYPHLMSESVENTGAPSDPAENQDPSSQAQAAGYDASQDPDADPESMNPRDLRGEGSHEGDPDLDPDSLNPRGEA